MSRKRVAHFFSLLSNSTYNLVSNSTFSKSIHGWTARSSCKRRGLLSSSCPSNPSHQNSVDLSQTSSSAHSGKGYLSPGFRSGNRRCPPRWHTFAATAQITGAQNSDAGVVNTSQNRDTRTAQKWLSLETQHITHNHDDALTYENNSAEKRSGYFSKNFDIQYPHKTRT